MEIKASQRRHHETSKGGRGDPGYNLKGYRIVLEVFRLQSWIATQSFALLSGDGFYLRAGRRKSFNQVQDDGTCSSLTKPYDSTPLL